MLIADNHIFGLFIPREQSSWGHHGAHLVPGGPSWAPRCPMNLAIRVASVKASLNYSNALNKWNIIVQPSCPYSPTLVSIQGLFGEQVVSKCQQGTNNGTIDVKVTLSYGRDKSKAGSNHVIITRIRTRAPTQYKDRLIYVWRFPC